MKAIAVVVSAFFGLSGLLFAGDSNKVAAVLLEIQQTPSNGAWQIEEDDLNAFFLDVLRREQTQEVKAVSVHLLEDSFRSIFVLDLDKLLADRGVNLSGFLPAFSGTQELDLTGEFIGKDGLGKYRTLEASLGGIQLPATIVDYLLASLTKRFEPGLNLSEAFTLPEGLKAVKLTEGEVRLEK